MQGGVGFIQPEPGKALRARHQNSFSAKKVAGALLDLDQRMADDGTIDMGDLEDAFHSDLMFPHLLGTAMNNDMTTGNRMTSRSSVNVGALHRISQVLSPYCPTSRIAWITEIETLLRQHIESKLLCRSQTKKAFLRSVLRHLHTGVVVWNICKLLTVISVGGGNIFKLRNRNEPTNMRLRRDVIDKLASKRRR